MRVEASTFEELIEAALAGLSAMILHSPMAVEAKEVRRFEIRGAEPDLLLFDALNEALYRFETERWIAHRARVQRTQEGLSIELCGEPYDEARHEPHHEVKAITYHGLQAAEQGGLWRASVIVDI